MCPEEPGKSIDFLPRTPAMIAAALALLCAIAYLPALNNGFISDDYVILSRASGSGAELSDLFRMVPERFRITTYLAFGVLKSLFGYHAAAFYCFTILLHFANSVLMWKLLGCVTGSLRVAVLGAMIFAVGQSPQEGVMWLAAMNEELLTLFVQATLLLWLRKRYPWSAAACVGAFFSKEPAAVILLLLPLTEFAARRRFVVRHQILYIAVPAVVLGLVFFLSLSNNALVQSGLYGLGGRALLVWLNSLHRLMFPWGYLAVLLWFIVRRGVWPAGAGAGLVWMTAALLPYIFLTYQNHVPSRHMYLASIGFAWALAEIVREIRVEKLRSVFVAALIVMNVGYLWIVKDRQYEQRAAPTSRLIQQLAGRPPEPVLVEAFPLNPWVAKETARLLPGWDPQMIRVNEPRENCPACLILIWDPLSEQYLGRTSKLFDVYDTPPVPRRFREQTR